ncbi:protein of unknown function [Ruminococcaceae bacterium D5]|nr:protein of unknown function [Ruminococcaceae bacterium D5]
MSRGKGKSAVAAAAYRSGEKLTNEWDGMTHDYTRKGGVVHTEIMLPSHAPPSFSDRSTLWNSVELYEKAGNAQLAREIDAALPIELSREEQIRLVREYCSSQFVSRGMCVDFAIHDTDSGNPHCHIMLTMRPLDERGTWAAKSKKEYDLDENGERIRLPSGRYKTHKVDLTGWNDKDNTLLWRKAWADISHVPVYIMGEETLSKYALYMSVLGNRPDLFGNSEYISRYITNRPAGYEIPASALEDETFATLIAEAEKYIGYPYMVEKYPDLERGESASKTGRKQNLREAIQHVTEYEAEFIQEAADSSMRDRDAEFARKREALSKADQRIAELDRIISRMYEDNVMGKLSDERFIKMSRDYELEQSNLKSMAEVLRKELKQQEQQKTNVKAFIATVKKYTDMQELDATLLREFIDRIEVSHADRKTKTREITIVYNFIGAFDFARAIDEAQHTTKKQQKTA